MTKRQLVLEDGTTFIGEGFGSEIAKSGEVIFNTGMTGYQEVITDPTYCEQLVVMTYPVVGSYGINRDDFESITPFINGLIVKEVSHEPSNFRNEESLDAYLKAHDIPGISNIDTRMLTRVLREKGTIKGIITNVDEKTDDVVSQLKERKESIKLVEKTSIRKPYIVPGKQERIVVIDLGMKYSILHELTERNCHVTVVPFDCSAESILRYKPDGVLLSNGPGNPSDVKETIETVKSLLGKTPLFGIGLGHQLFAIACGAEAVKLKVGQHGTNYPVKGLQQNRSWLTTQSQQYTLVEETISDELTITYRSLNDNSIEGLQHKKHLAFSVQFNPEGSPGTNETNFLFDEFLQMINNQLKDGVDIHA